MHHGRIDRTANGSFRAGLALAPSESRANAMPLTITQQISTSIQFMKAILTTCTFGEWFAAGVCLAGPAATLRRRWGWRHSGRRCSSDGVQAATSNRSVVAELSGDDGVVHFHQRSHFSILVCPKLAVVNGLPEHPFPRAVRFLVASSCSAVPVRNQRTN